MEQRTSKLAQLTLVSKYYPVANYSYPRSEGCYARTPYNSRRCSNESEDKRTSLASSQASAMASPYMYPFMLSLPLPSLIDDRTDSEASADDDDIRYHAHGDELWDSFLESGLYIHDNLESRAAAMASSVAAPECVPPMVPQKDYPALIASPHQVRRRPLPQEQRAQECSWPLSDSPPRRRPSPIYSAFPKIVSIPSGQCSRQSSSSQLSTVCSTDVPCAPKDAPPLPPRPAGSHPRSSSPHPRAFSPATFMVLQRPNSSHGSRPNTPLDYYYPPPPSPPPTAPLPALPPLSSRPPHPSTLTPRSSNLSHVEPTPTTTKTIRPYKSTTQLRPPPPLEPLPISVFEYDTDSDCDDEDDESSSSGSPTLSFFRFHRRSQSPNTAEGILARRRGSASKTGVQQSFVDAATVAKDRRRRKRTNTMESLGKQSDVLSRMLGRRSR
ncbi:von Willebrand factor and related coagulation protein [Trichoderma simmonsii]|uniref:von Willebrand factor and related coagulation protein n=1 Tax=Trichoderma simmonsii TaxID=1491479 RepID=A0A8G0LEI5_9HYPO|nr:von Willebrand factor and related coagulation protein [Trichoderma simmonsii]